MHVSFSGHTVKHSNQKTNKLLQCACTLSIPEVSNQNSPIICNIMLQCQQQHRRAESLSIWSQIFSDLPPDVLLQGNIRKATVHATSILCTFMHLHAFCCLPFIYCHTSSLPCIFHRLQNVCMSSSSVLMLCYRFIFDPPVLRL